MCIGPQAVQITPLFLFMLPENGLKFCTSKLFEEMPPLLILGFLQNVKAQAGVADVRSGGYRCRGAVPGGAARREAVP